MGLKSSCFWRLGAPVRNIILRGLFCEPSSPRWKGTECFSLYIKWGERNFKGLLSLICDFCSWTDMVTWCLWLSPGKCKRLASAPRVGAKMLVLCWDMPALPESVRARDTYVYPRDQTKATNAWEIFRLMAFCNVEVSKEITKAFTKDIALNTWGPRLWEANLQQYQSRNNFFYLPYLFFFPLLCRWTRVARYNNNNDKNTGFSVKLEFEINSGDLYSIIYHAICETNHAQKIIHCLLQISI